MRKKMGLESSGIVFDIAPDIAEHPAIEVGNDSRRACHHDGVFVFVRETSRRETVGVALTAVEVGDTEAVTEFVLKNVNIGI